MLVAYAEQALEWRNDLDSPNWDRAVAALGGHPLQSALWGNARRTADGIVDHRWIALYEGKPVWMARIEERRLPALGWVGWMPRGPTGDLVAELPAKLQTRLERSGMVLLITDRWQARGGDAATGTLAPRTIWIDLTVGLERLSQNLDKKMRRGLGRARRVGVTVDMSTGGADIADFFALCRAVSERKEFHFPVSLLVMEQLLSSPAATVEARLFLARYQGRIGAGAFIIRSGRSLHYFWGAMNREASEARVGEAVQWAVIEWGIAQGCTRYDLEGIDPVRNPGTYAFKKKMGGQEVALIGKRYYPVGISGHVMAWIDRKLR